MDVVALFAGCRTEADFYRVQLDAERRLAPAEVAALLPPDDALPEAQRLWLARLGETLALAGGALEPFRRRPLADNVTHFEGVREGAAPRSLVLAFTDVAQRMNVPVAIFLQALPAAACDVVVFADPTRTAFLSGVPGYADGIAALVARLARDLPTERYPGGIRCIGSSAGAAAALSFAIAAGARRGVSLDGAHPAALPMRHAGRIDRTTLLDPATHAPPGTVLLSVHGAQHRRDRIRGPLLALGLPGARSIAVETGGEKTHGLLAVLLARRALARFLAEILLADTPAEEMPAVWQA